MKEIKENFTSTVNDIVIEIILKVKASVIEALKEKTLKNAETLKLGYLIWKKLGVNKTSKLGEITLKYIAYQ